MADQDISKQLTKLRNNFRKDLRDSVNDIRLDALYQQLLMQHVFDRPEPLAAMTSWSIAPEFAWWLYQHVLNQRPEKIIELGSGTSTLVIAAALKKIGAGRFLSFEHDHAYMEKTRALLETCDLQDHVELLYAPLEPLELSGQTYRWYDLPYDLIDHMIGRNQLDMLIIDGPPASTNQHARYPAMVCLQEYCSQSTVVLLDDAAREEEQEILSRWTELLGGGYAHRMLSNVRHGPALFYAENPPAPEVIYDRKQQTLGETYLPEIERLLGDELGGLGHENSGDLASRLLDEFFRYRERSLDEVKRQCATAHEQHHKLNLELTEELNSVIHDCNELRAERNELARQQKLIYKSMAYQLGVAIYRQTRSVKGWVKLPVAIWRVLRRHAGSGNHEMVGALLSKASHDKKLPQLNAVELKTYSPELQRTVRKTNPKNVLWVASQVAHERGYQAALEFAEPRVSKTQRLALNLLRANANLHSETEWLKHLNAYLAPFELAPISLTAEEGSRFSRISVSESLPQVDGPLITVIMPAFNSETTLAHAAESILAQTWKNIQLIIIDDCSTDGTWDVAQRVAAKDARVLLRRNTVNVGPYVSKNLALRLAEGEYVTGQDADDWSHPQRLERDILPILSSGGRLLATLSGMLRMNDEAEFNWFSEISSFSMDGVRRTASISLLINTEFLRESLGGWDCVRFGADSELINRAEKIMGGQFERLDHIGMFCLDQDKNLTNHPTLGISRVTGISPTRKEFRDSYLQWHSKIDKNNAKLAFPHASRKFKAPTAMLVPLKDIEMNIEYLSVQ